MAICSNFLFVRIHFFFKLVVGSLIVGFYSWIIFGSFDFLFEVSCESQQDICLQQMEQKKENKIQYSKIRWKKRALNSIKLNFDIFVYLRGAHP